MAKEISVSALSTDEALYRFYRISLDFEYNGVQRESYIASVVNSTMNWYISTGRASLEFMKIFVNLSKCRMATIFKKCIKADARTEQEVITIIRKYFKIDEGR